MFFRPSFCANCGEKIDRADWGIFTSRRFCQVCESEYKGIDLIPRVIVVAALLFGVLGLGGYLRTAPRPDASITRGVAKNEENPPARTLASASQPLSSETVPSIGQPTSNSNVNRPRSFATPQAQVPAEKGTDEPIYICGAQTKKGTPCSRRVKGNVRCFQHAGMPAMLPADQLRIKQ